MDTEIAFSATFPNGVTAAGFVFRCFACDSLPNDTSMNWTLFSDAGSVVASGSAIYDLSTPTVPMFFGITSDVPFRSIAVNRTSLSQSGGGNWFADDVRYATSAVPSLEIQMSQVSYVNGETVTASTFRLANPTAEPVAVELKVWIGTPIPGLSEISAFNLGADGSLVLPAGFDQELGPFLLFPVSADLPRGTYEFSSRMRDPITGELLSEDLNSFAIQ